MNYGKAVKIARAIAGIQQKELARKSGLDASHISLIEKGKRKPSVTAVGQICRALGIPEHLFSLLAAESEDLKGVSQEEIARLGESLAKFMFQYEQQKPATKRRRTRAA